MTGEDEIKTRAKTKAEATEKGKVAGVKCVLLDIEGTICPISFVKETLFPYALRALPSVLQEQWDAPTFISYRDAFPEHTRTSPATLQAHIEQLTRDDAKVAALKDLQGHLWRDGYENGVYATPLFPDVAPCLKGWYGEGVRLGIYSSGSVFAQKLLFGHVKVEEEVSDGKKTTAAAGEKRSIDEAESSADAVALQPPSKKVAAEGGKEAETEDGETTATKKKGVDASQTADTDKVATEDLQYLISDWFDTTNAGPKKESSSYAKIAEALELSASDILFLTDSVEEYDAATSAGFAVGLMVRPGNPPMSEADVGRCRIMRSLEEAELR